ncbi:hypothetical protein K443DRAFT_686987 [Laccaria amethystina LaAM-08-1]|uniref:Uncharacterized protein n=1 Tax=Laccaria amethystina LaAM-08-1 TaxID=1095629 RepID=A0A0C9WQN2_9AGAR|nr:hypothetical protein K443DRAFT_686987 [Laccaria amethystina LaAM-08-1]
MYIPLFAHSINTDVAPGFVQVFHDPSAQRGPLKAHKAECPSSVCVHSVYPLEYYTSAALPVKRPRNPIPRGLPQTNEGSTA